jgi:hypothetical protein
VSSGFPLLERTVLRKYDGDRTDDRDGAQAFCGCCEIEDFYVIPKRVTVELA